MYHPYDSTKENIEEEKWNFIIVVAVILENKLAWILDKKGQRENKIIQNSLIMRYEC